MPVSLTPSPVGATSSLALLPPLDQSVWLHLHSHPPAQAQCRWSAALGAVLHPPLMRRNQGNLLFSEPQVWLSRPPLPGCASQFTRATAELSSAQVRSFCESAYWNPLRFIHGRAICQDTPLKHEASCHTQVGSPIFCNPESCC